MNEFSVVCRVLGTLFYRQPQDPLLEPLFTLIKEGKLQQHWPLEQDELLTRLQQHCTDPQLAADFNALFVGSECSVSPLRSSYVEGASEADVRVFLQQRGMPLGEAPADHFGSLLLAASWLEDQSQEDEVRRKSRCLTSSCCLGVAASWVRLKHTPPAVFTVLWQRSLAMPSQLCVMS